MMLFNYTLEWIGLALCIAAVPVIALDRTMRMGSRVVFTMMALLGTLNCLDAIGFISDYKQAHMYLLFSWLGVMCLVLSRYWPEKRLAAAEAALTQKQRVHEQASSFVASQSQTVRMLKDGSK